MIVYLLSRKRASRITYRAVSALPSRSASLTSCLTLPSLRSRRGALLCDPSLLPPRPWPCGRDSTARLPASNGPTNRPNSLKSGCVNYLQSSKSPLFEAFLYSIYSFTTSRLRTAFKPNWGELRVASNQLRVHLSLSAIREASVLRIQFWGKAGNYVNIWIVDFFYAVPATPTISNNFSQFPRFFEATLCLLAFSNYIHYRFLSKRTEIERM